MKRQLKVASRQHFRLQEALFPAGRYASDVPWGVGRTTLEGGHWNRVVGKRSLDSSDACPEYVQQAIASFNQTQEKGWKKKKVSDNEE